MADKNKNEHNSNMDMPENLNELTNKSPLVFVSHDTRDGELAEAFSKLLSSVSAGVLKSFCSSDRRGNQGMAYGVEWYPEIMKNLRRASDVVALLTHNSLDRPWILYEVGVAKGMLDTPVLGIAIGIPLNKANNGPFAQFQNSDDDIDSLTKLLVQLVKRIPNSEPDTAVIKIQVENFKQQAVEILRKKTISEDKKTDLIEDSSVSKLFEEIKIMFDYIQQNLNQKMPEPIEHTQIIDSSLFNLRLSNQKTLIDSEYKTVRAEFFVLSKIKKLVETRINAKEITIDGLNIHLPIGLNGVCIHKRHDGSLICEEAFLSGVVDGYARYFNQKGELVGEDYYKEGGVTQTRVFK